MTKSSHLNCYYAKPNTMYFSHGYPKKTITTTAVIDWSRLLWPNGCFLTPAIIGIAGASILGFSVTILDSSCTLDKGMAEHEVFERSEVNCTNKSSCANEKIASQKAVFLVNIYTLIATASISLYIIGNLFLVMPQFWLTLSTIIVGAITAILLFSSMYFYVYRINPGSFSSKYLGSNIFYQYFSFIYFSATNISVGSFGDILPLTIGSRTLVIMEVLFFLFILSCGIAVIHKAK
ncbi:MULTISPECIES: hypothetical protein [Desulfosporosinus]|uniref:Potassium channel domain-containing protein n=1 Tax=Desulfosporosinus acididurans TaxID=476652 RepID=A0A0J1FL48_9FIRM|nr:MULTISPECIES: hypothetical protein [Desulfosporosinus]KLU64092.1 hypothetical protein DEAC_c39070 [Desulfosporosinus acididurans]